MVCEFYINDWVSWFATLFIVQVQGARQTMYTHKNEAKTAVILSTKLGKYLYL